MSALNGWNTHTHTHTHTLQTKIKNGMSPRILFFKIFFSKEKNTFQTDQSWQNLPPANLH